MIGLLRSPTDVRDLALVRLLWGSGARRLEIVRIKVSEVDFETGLITLVSTKNKKERVVPMTDDVTQGPEALATPP